MEVNRKSRLKTWTAQPVVRGRRRLLGIICPNCNSRAIVSRSWASEDITKYKTRPCAYCFVAAWLPGEHPNEKESSNG